MLFGNLFGHVLLLASALRCLGAPLAGSFAADGRAAKPAGHRVIVRYTDAEAGLEERAGALRSRGGVLSVKPLYKLGMAVVSCSSSEVQEQLVEDLDQDQDIELVVPDTMLSAFPSSEPVTAPWQRPDLAKCSANPACHARGLTGDCCPLPGPDGAMLSCCSSQAPAEISLRTHHGNLMSADAAGNVFAHSADPTDLTKFDVISLEGTNVSLRSHKTGKFISVREENGALSATVDVFEEAARFEWIKNENGTVSLKSHFGRYLCAESDGALYANRLELDLWEQFDMIEVAGPGQRLPDDPDLVKLWGMHHWGDHDIDAAEAWRTSTGEVGAGIVVGVIDTGIDYHHEDLKEQMWVNPNEIPDNGIDDDDNGYIDDVHGANFITDSGDPLDDQMHGTHCSGTIAGVGNNDVGVSGVAWRGVQLMALKFLSSTGSGQTSDAIKAIDYAVAHGAKILSNSWGGGGSNAALRVAIEHSEAAGILFVAAAGNSGSNNDEVPSFPANYKTENMVSVASTTVLGELSSFSCYGNESVHVAAPGSNIFSTIPGDKYESLSGTSMATPHVSGLAALVWMFRPALSMTQVKDIIFESVKPLPSLDGRISTGGLINAKNALETAWAFQPPKPPAHAAGGIAFADVDPKVGAYAGTVTITAAADESDVDYYRVYFVSGAGFQLQPLGEQIPATGSAEVYLTTNGSFVPSQFAKSLAVVTGNAQGERPVHQPLGEDAAAAAPRAVLEDYGVPEFEPRFVTWGGDTDLMRGAVEGELIIGRAQDEQSVTEYNIYWHSGTKRGAKLGSVPAAGFAEPRCSGDSCDLLASGVSPTGAHHFQRGAYGNDESATIKVSGPGTVTLTKLDTEDYYDFLSIGSSKLTGNLASELPREFNLPEGPTSIVWYSDPSVTASGWSLDVVQTDAEIRFHVKVSQLPAPSIEVVPAYRGNEMDHGVVVAVKDYDTTMAPSPAYAPASLSFTDMDPTVGSVSGIARVAPSARAGGGVVFYRVDFADARGVALDDGWGWTVQAKGSDPLEVHIPPTEVPAGAALLVARAGNNVGLGDRVAKSEADQLDVVPSVPTNVTFQDMDGGNGTIGGYITVQGAESEAGIISYAAFWYSAGAKAGEIARGNVSGYGADTVIQVPSGTTVDSGTILVVSVYAWGEMEEGVTVDIEDEVNRRLEAAQAPAAPPQPVAQPWMLQEAKAQTHEIWAAPADLAEASKAERRIRCSATLPLKAEHAATSSVRGALAQAFASSLKGVKASEVRALRVERLVDGSGVVLDFEIQQGAVNLDRVEAKLILMSLGGRSTSRLRQAMSAGLSSLGKRLEDGEVRVAEPKQLGFVPSALAGRKLESVIADGAAVDTAAEEGADEESAGAAGLATLFAASAAVMAVGAAAAISLRRRSGETVLRGAGAGPAAAKGQKEPLQAVSVQEVAGTAD